MSFHEEHVVQVMCDSEGCYAIATKGDTERQAEKNALEDGFIHVDGKWYCQDCNPPKKRGKRKS